MNPYAAERLTSERTSQLRAEAAKRRPLGAPTRVLRHQTGWALIQIGLALVTTPARRQRRTIGPELP